MASSYASSDLDGEQLAAIADHSDQNRSATAAMFPHARSFNINGGQPRFNNAVNLLEISDTEGNGMKILENHVSDEAIYDSSRRGPDTRCHPNTRQVIIKAIMDWVDDDTTSATRLLWLYGSAGIGKSAIAQTVAERLSAEGKLAGTFFFSKKIPGCHSASRLFTTLAWQLAMYIPEIKPHIDKALQKDPHLPTKSIETLFDRLIVDPINAGGSLVHASRNIVVIDGVDECDGTDGRTPEKMQAWVLKILKDAAVPNKVPLRFFILSRPEPHIQRELGMTLDSFGIRGTIPGPITARTLPRVFRVLKGFSIHLFSLMSRLTRMPFIWISTVIIFKIPYVKELLNLPLPELSPTTSTLVSSSWCMLAPFTLPIMPIKSLKSIHLALDSSVLDRIITSYGLSHIGIGESHQSKLDLKRYFMEELDRISQGNSELLNSPGLEEVINSLTEKSCCQFMYASTVIRFIEERGHDPMKSLRTVLGLRPADSSPFAELDQLYLEILQSYVKKHSKEDEQFLWDFLAVLTTFIDDPFFALLCDNTPMFVTLLDLTEAEIRGKLRGMYSLVNPSGNSFGIHHISFLEFLRDRARSKEYHFTYAWSTGRFLWLWTKASCCCAWRAITVLGHDSGNLENLRKLMDVHNAAIPSRRLSKAGATADPSFQKSPILFYMTLIVFFSLLIIPLSPYSMGFRTVLPFGTLVFSIAIRGYDILRICVQAPAFFIATFSLEAARLASAY